MSDTEKLLKDLIKIDSSTMEGANRAVAFCENWLTERGLPVRKLENNGFHMLVSEIGSGDKTIVLNGHVDVVKGKEEQFSPYIKERKMYGRGSADMKAGVAAMMEAAAQAQKHELHSRIQLQIVSDEETGGLNGTKFLTEQGYLGDFVICGEPTELGIGVQSKGVLQLDIETKGKPAHGSRPWEGQNAIKKAYQLYEEILKLPFAAETEPPMYNNPSINLAKIEGGTVYNKVPEHCKMSIDIRYLPKQSVDDIIKQIKEAADAKVDVHIINDPVKTQADDPYVEALAASVKERTQLERANIFGQHGSSDGQFFTKYNKPAVEFGPFGHNWHGDNELVYLDTVHAYQDILLDFVLQFSKVEERAVQNK
ncbi:M20 family metallopeptidase [Alteribacillus bidgolensis]|uniref:Succinyl-diaminopimelate desuccinylase n=1 Tax=Alteribacillus bidgolensis TaxID=930129 RepID=A0A1G8QCL5_9BACI|nr:M20/M25/M40 family metallo-hydrolase [Alteribacillus bidgolensis]SDJ02549.1 succinyl-diaminopimelate desuccinylase [Alteribacillus bidgolensis]